MQPASRLHFLQTEFGVFRRGVSEKAVPTPPGRPLAAYCARYWAKRESIILPALSATTPSAAYSAAGMTAAALRDRNAGLD